MKIDPKAVEKYRTILEKDPKSQVFAPLAEAYREMGNLKEAEKIVTVGVQRHPIFVSGLVTYAKIMRDLKKTELSLNALKKACSLSPENILAHQLLAEAHLNTKNPKEALKAFKMVLFLNPNSQSAQKAVRKLESLTADEYDDEVFAMTKLPEVSFSPPQKNESPNTQTNDFPSAPAEAPPKNKSLERVLSLIDAFIIRNDLEKARALLEDSMNQYGRHNEISKRMESLQKKSGENDEAMPLKPISSRENLIREKKLETLQIMLRKIEEYRAQG